jgi:hypothetical protein
MMGPQIIELYFLLEQTLILILFSASSYLFNHFIQLASLLKSFNQIAYLKLIFRLNLLSSSSTQQFTTAFRCQIDFPLF